MTDLQSKKEFMDSVQKVLTRSCMQLCFQQTHVKQPCIDRCFDKFVRSLQSVSEEMLIAGRDVGSEYPRRLKREPSLFTDLIYSEASVTYKMTEPGEAQAFDKATNKSR